MKPFKMAAVAAISVVTMSPFAMAGKEGGGLGFFDTLHKCTESKPTNPQNPLLAFVTDYPSGLQLIVRETIKPQDPAKEFVYAGDVVRNEEIRCITECHIYENQADSVWFGVTVLGDYKTANFQMNGKAVNFDCR